uniref:Uncharacterized protein n=1 Tax=Thalassia hemprichii TaxID=55496 RepID=A0A4Y1KCI9_9LILI|nr:hypothetical protein [Thalassia hemprichii]ATP74889.1 hypothetical protein [Thalassia hemprichii]
MVSNLFSLSHLKSIWILHSDLIGKTMEKNLSLFRNLLSLLCRILRFRHDFSDLDSFQNGSNMPFCFFFFLWKGKENRKDGDYLMIHFGSKKFDSFCFRQIRLFPIC